MGIEISVVTLDYEVGDPVKITGGPLANYTGTVYSISDDKKTVTVHASMFGRTTPVNVKSSEVERLV